MNDAQWRQANLAHVDAVVADIVGRLCPDSATPVAAPDPCTPPPALERLAHVFGLTSFEEHLLALAVAAELRPEVRSALAADGNNGAATFAAAARLFPDPHWSAISPGRPLRSAGLLQLGPGAVPDAPLTIEERVLHHVLGLDDLDGDLAATATTLEASDALVPSQELAANAVLACWRGDTNWPIVHLQATRSRDGRQVAARAATLADTVACLLRHTDIAVDPARRAIEARNWRRELSLCTRLLVVDVTDAAAGGTVLAHVAAFLDAVVGPVVLLGGRVDTVRAQRVVDVDMPTDDEQRTAWNTSLRRHLNGSARRLDGAVERAVGQFRLGTTDIDDVAASLHASVNPGAELWSACRARTRPSLDQLAERVVGTATWDDLVLPDAERDTLHAIARHVEQRTGVQRAWGMTQGTRGRGITALFHGPSGTGKTLAAEVIANQVGLDLYRVDLSAVVSKYIGETEKNLRRVFDAAEDGGAVLLFDEADALFGKRTEVRDSHDRYANIEVSYLLSRMETYRGLAVLTTNARSALDGAFLRRLRFVVAFPFPDEAQRAEMWRRVFPAAVPTDGIDPVRLARLGTTGATIHQIALHASYEAAADRRPVTVEHIRRAAMREFSKLDKTLSQAESAALR